MVPRGELWRRLCRYGGVTTTTTNRHCLTDGLLKLPLILLMYRPLVDLIRLPGDSFPLPFGSSGTRTAAACLISAAGNWVLFPILTEFVERRRNG